MREFCYFACVSVSYFRWFWCFFFRQIFKLKNFQCPYIQWSAGLSSVHNVPATRFLFCFYLDMSICFNSLINSFVKLQKWKSLDAPEIKTTFNFCWTKLKGYSTTVFEREFNKTETHLKWLIPSVPFHKYVIISIL